MRGDTFYAQSVSPARSTSVVSPPISRIWNVRLSPVYIVALVVLLPNTSSAEEGNVREWIIVSWCINMVVSGSFCPCESGQWMSSEQECDQRRLLGVSLSYRRGPDVPLPAHTHLSALRLPLNGTLALDHLLFLHAWVALGLRGKNADHLSPLFSLALWCLKCDCSWIVAAFSWRFWHEKQAGLSGLSHGQWSRTKTISRLTVGYYYQGEWGTKHRGFLSHEIHFSSKF